MEEIGGWVELKFVFSILYVNFIEFRNKGVCNFYFFIYLLYYVNCYIFIILCNDYLMYQKKYLKCVC